MSVILPTKPYQLAFEHRPNYLYVCVGSETNDLEIAKRYWIEILSLLHRRRYSRVLLEKDLGKPLPAHDVFTLVSQLARNGLSEVSIAVFDHNFERDRCVFEQLVGTNRGLNLHIAATFCDTEQWLLAQHDYVDIKILPQMEDLIAPRWAA